MDNKHIHNIADKELRDMIALRLALFYMHVYFNAFAVVYF